MKKGILIKLLTLILLLCVALCFAGCGDSHEHDFSQKVATEEFIAEEQKCEKQAKYYYSCECGAKGTKTFNWGEIYYHLYSEYVPENNATCTTPATQIATCMREGCGKTSRKVFPNSVLGHSFTNYVVVKEPKCDTRGEETAVCDRDGCEETDTKTIKVLGHSYTNYIVDKDATCTENGSKTAVCDRDGCSKTKTETITKLGHTEGDWIIDADATCTEDGSKHQVCSVCNDTIDTEIITARHTEGNWIIDADATCTEDGSKHQVCSVCDDTIKTVAIPATGHSGGKATCIEAPICSICNVSYNQPLGHIKNGIICSRCNNYTITMCEIGKNYIENDGLTITLNSYTITEYEGYYSYTINYTIKNEVPNSKKLPGTFKLFFADGTGENQYGAFNYLYYGDSTTRTYTWKVLKTQTVLILEYNADSQDGFFKKTPSESSLHWLPFNKENS